MGVLMIVATATAISLAFAGRAGAMPLSAPSMLGVPAKAGIAQPAAVVCGYYGCVRVYPRSYPYYGYYRQYGWYGRRW